MPLAITIIALAGPVLIALKNQEETRQFLVGRALRLRVREEIAVAEFKRDRALVIWNVVIVLGMEMAVVFVLLYERIPAPYPMVAIGLGTVITAVGIAGYVWAMYRLFRRVFGSRA